MARGMLRSLNMEEISVSSTGMKSPVSHGLVLTASARKSKLA
jgi:hypothetical protein